MLSKTIHDERQQPLPFAHSEWSAPSPTSWPTWPERGRVCLDVETHDEKLKQLGPGEHRGSYIVGVGVGIENGPRLYLPIRHEGGENLDEQQVLRYLREQTAKFRGDIVGQNLAYDLGFLYKEGLVFHQDAKYRDTQIAMSLIDEHRNSYSLDNLAYEFLGERKDETLLREATVGMFGAKADPKAMLWRLPASLVGAYGEADVDLPLRLLRVLEAEIERQELGRVWELETNVLPVFAGMRRRGVPVDLSRLDEIEDRFIGQRKAYFEEIKRLSGVDLSRDIMNATRCAEALIAAGEADQRTLPRTGKTKAPSVTKELLAEIGGPCADAILGARKRDKLVNTFCAMIREHVCPDGRVHPSWNQVRDSNEDGSRGTVGGRPSCSNPNLLFLPMRDPELGPLFRSIFVPEDGAIWCKGDFSSQEPRLAVHFAHLTRDRVGRPLPGAAEAVARYRANPGLDIHGWFASVIWPGIQDKPDFKQWRGRAKTVFLGKCYGMGQIKLCHDLGYETVWAEDRHGNWRQMAGPEGQALIEDFRQGVPFVEGLAHEAQRVAGARGYIKTLLGRRCRFPMVEGFGRDWLHKALNRLIQGSAADQTKQAMVDMDRAGYNLYVQVYDEVDLPVLREEDAGEVKRIMENAVELVVPSVAEVSTGSTWGEAAAK